jgi:hypothetical protein
MAYYKIYKIDEHGQIFGPPFEYDGVDDEAAAAEATKRAGAHGVEVWELDRQVTVIAPAGLCIAERGT